MIQKLNPRFACRNRSMTFGLVVTRGVGKKRRILDWTGKSRLKTIIDKLCSTTVPSLLRAENFSEKGANCVVKTNSRNTASYDRDSVIDRPDGFKVTFPIELSI